MLTAPALESLGAPQGARLPEPLADADRGADSLEEARDLRQAFGQFVGETFFGQMLKAMRATVGEPAYFHGGMAEEQFQARLDQQVAQDLAQEGGAGLAADLFRAQFPAQAALLDRTDAADTQGLGALDALRRR